MKKRCFFSLAAVFGMFFTTWAFISCNLEAGLGEKPEIPVKIEKVTVEVKLPSEIEYITIDPPPPDNGKLTIRNSTPGQDINFIRVKYPDGTSKVIPGNIKNGESKQLSLPEGSYDIDISEDGIYYSSKEGVAVEPSSVDSEGKTLDTANKFQPPWWWRQGGCDPEKYDPKNPNNHDSSDPGSTNIENPPPVPAPVPTQPDDSGTLTIKNSTPNQTIRFIRVKYPDGSYKVIPKEIANGNNSEPISLPKGTYDVAISEDGIYYSKDEPVTIAAKKDTSLDTKDKFQPSWWWKQGGYDPDKYDPTNPNNHDPKSPGSTNPDNPAVIAPVPDNNGTLIIKNSTPNQTIHFIRVTYPDKTYKVIPKKIANGEQESISLLQGNYDIAISEDGVYYSKNEPITIVAKKDTLLDTNDKFKPSGWWKQGGYDPDQYDPNKPDDHDPNHPGSTNPDNPLSILPSEPTDTEPTDPGTTEPIVEPSVPEPEPFGYLQITNKGSLPIDTIEVIYKARPDGSTDHNPDISARIPKDTQTFTLDPELKPESSVILALIAGKYDVRLGYKGANNSVTWLDNKNNQVIKDDKTTEVTSTPGGIPTPNVPIPPPGFGYLKVTNNGSSPIDTIEVTYKARLDGSTNHNPDISATDPKNQLTFTLNPELKPGYSVILTLTAGKYDVRLGYKGTNASPTWLDNRTGQAINEGTTTEVISTPGGTAPGLGYLQITNNSAYQINLAEVTYKARPDGSTDKNPDISATAPKNKLTFTLNPELTTGKSILLALTAGSYEVRVGYKDAAGKITWFDIGNAKNQIIYEGKTASVEMVGGESGPGGGPASSNYYIIIKNSYPGCIVNVINVYQIPGTAPGTAASGGVTLNPNPTGKKDIPPLAYGDTHIYKVPTPGSYKVRMGYWDKDSPQGPGNPFWYNDSNAYDDDGPGSDWNTKPGDTVIVGTEPPFGETNKGNETTDNSGANNNPGKTGDTQPGAYYIIVRNQYDNTDINVINVYQMPGSTPDGKTTMDPNPSGLVFINPPLAPGEIYYYQVPSRGIYKVRMGFYDVTQPIGKENPWWFNASNTDEDPGNPRDWVNEPKNTVVIGTTPPFGETTIKDEPIDNSKEDGNKGKYESDDESGSGGSGGGGTPHQWAHLKVVNTGKNKIYAVLATNYVTDDTLHPADAEHDNKPWFDYGDATPLKGQYDMTKTATRNLLNNAKPYLAPAGDTTYARETKELEVPPGEIYVHIYRSSGTSSTVYHDYKKINTYIDVLTIVSFKDSTFETYPEYTTPTVLRDDEKSVGSVTIINRESTKGHIPIQEVLIANYGEAEKVVALTDVNLGLYTAYIDWKKDYDPDTALTELAAGTSIPSDKKTSTRSGKIPNVLSMKQFVPKQPARNAGTLNNWHDGSTFGVPQNGSITFNLKPGLYRVAVRTTRDDHWYGGKTLYFWKAVHIREGVPVVLSFDGYHLEP